MMMMKVEEEAPQCYKYSRSRAWCRAMRSEWLEILQKGMLCWGERQSTFRVRDKDAGFT